MHRAASIYEDGLAGDKVAFIRCEKRRDSDGQGMPGLFPILQGVRMLLRAERTGRPGRPKAHRQREEIDVKATRRGFFRFGGMS